MEQPTGCLQSLTLALALLRLLNNCSEDNQPWIVSSNSDHGVALPLL